MKRIVAMACAMLLLGLVPAVHARDTLVVANFADIRTLDPVLGSENVTANVHLQMYDNLVYINNDGVIDPMLAESWEYLDPTTIVFHLKKGVKFHNGEDCTAEDVKFTMDRAMSPFGVAASVLVRPIESVEARDPHTVVFKLKYPFTPFLMALGESWGGIVSKKAVESGVHDKTPMGTGPFKFVEWRKGDRVVLERFDGYHGQKPAYKTLVIRTIPENSARTIELESGGVDIAYNIFFHDIKRIESNPKLKLLRMKTNRVCMFGFNMEKKPLDDVRVRQALVKAIDVVGMQRAVWRGVGEAPNGPIPPGVKYYDKSLKPHVQDIDGAKALLKEAGVSNPKLVLMTSEEKDMVDAATIIQSMLGEVGVDVEIKVLEYGAYYDSLSRGHHDMYLTTWGNNLPDPEYSFSRRFGKVGIPELNYSRFNNPEFEALLQKGVALPEGPEREEVYVEMQRLFMKEAPAVYWNVYENIVGTSANVENFELRKLDFYKLWPVTFKQ